MNTVTWTKSYLSHPLETAEKWEKLTRLFKMFSFE